MSEGLYEIIALGARYAFAALMLLIVIRAWRITIVDSRRSARLRRWSPETGVVGEMQVVSGDGRARKGMVYPVIREGLIGRSAGADVRLRSRSVRRRYAYFEMTEEGLLVRAASGGRVGGRGRWAVLRDGDTLEAGRVKLLLVLTDAQAAPEPEAATPGETGPDALFDVAEDASLGAFDPEGNFAPPEDLDHSADEALYGEAPKGESAPGEEWWPHG